MNVRITYVDNKGDHQTFSVYQTDSRFAVELLIKSGYQIHKVEYPEMVDRTNVYKHLAERMPVLTS